MAKHDHHDCDHAIQLCKKCDEIYCTNCSAEWRKEPRWVVTSGTTTVRDYDNFYLCDNVSSTGGTGNSFTVNSSGEKEHSC